MTMDSTEGIHRHRHCQNQTFLLSQSLIEIVVKIPLATAEFLDLIALQLHTVEKILDLFAKLLDSRQRVCEVRCGG